MTIKKSIISNINNPSLFFLFTLLILLPIQLAKAEQRPTTSDLSTYVSSVGPVAFNQAGGVFVPLQVLYALRQGKVPPLQLFLLANNIMTNAVREVLKKTPGNRDSYIEAKAKFEWGLCMLQKAFQQASLMILLPQLSSNQFTGGTTDTQAQNASKQQGLLLAQSFQKVPGCDNSGDNGLDPQLIMMFSSQ